MWYRLSTKIITAGKKEVLQILGDDKLFETIQDISPDTKYQTTAAYFVKAGIDSEQVREYIGKLSEIDKRKKVSIFASPKGVRLNNENVDWIKFTEVIDAKYTTLDTRPKQKFTETPVVDGKITVQKAGTAEDACKLGANTTWCIAKPSGGIFQSYRDHQQSTFYFVNDGTQPKDSPLRKVVVDVNQREIQLTDLDNNTGYIDEFGDDSDAYLKYLAQQGVDTSQFVNDPHTEQEKEEYQLVGKRNLNLDWFKKLPYEYKSKYIGRGHALAWDQLEYLVNENANDLVAQYIGSGRRLDTREQEIIKSKKQWVETYQRARQIILKNTIKQQGIVGDFMASEVFSMDDEFIIDCLKDGIELDIVAQRAVRQNPKWYAAYKPGREKKLIAHIRSDNYVEDNNIQEMLDMNLNNALVEYLKSGPSLTKRHKEKIILSNPERALEFAKIYQAGRKNRLTDLINSPHLEILGDKVFEELLSFNDNDLVLKYLQKPARHEKFEDIIHANPEWSAAYKAGRKRVLLTRLMNGDWFDYDETKEIFKSNDGSLIVPYLQFAPPLNYENWEIVSKNPQWMSIYREARIKRLKDEFEKYGEVTSSMISELIDYNEIDYVSSIVMSAPYLRENARATLRERMPQLFNAFMNQRRQQYDDALAAGNKLTHLEQEQNFEYNRLNLGAEKPENVI